MGEAEHRFDLGSPFHDLADNETEKLLCFVRFAELSISELAITLMREALQRGHLNGNFRFIDEARQIIARRIEHHSPGRSQGRQTKKSARIFRESHRGWKMKLYPFFVLQLLPCFGADHGAEKCRVWR